MMRGYVGPGPGAGRYGGCGTLAGSLVGREIAKGMRGGKC